jgi:glycosyltransferase involved in cell wall biosynthesis
MGKKISVIIPCYEFSDYIEECILSVISQKVTSGDFEILIRDDFSNDGSSEIIEKYARIHPKIKYFKATENWGFQKNINFLMDQSKAEYIAYLDGDDYWVDPQKLQTQIDFLDSNPEFSMCFTGYWRQNGFDKTTIYLNYWHGPNFYDTDEVDPSLIISSNPINSLTRVFRNIDGLFKDYFFKCHINDLPLNYELSKVGKIKFLNFPSGVYRIHSNNFSTKWESDDSQSNSQELLNKTLDLILNNNEQ